MNIHLPAILVFTRGTGFWPMTISKNDENISGSEIVYLNISQTCIHLPCQNHACKEIWRFPEMGVPVFIEINHEINHCWIPLRNPPKVPSKNPMGRFAVGSWQGAWQPHPQTDLKFGRFWRDFRNAESSDTKILQPVESAKKKHQIKDPFGKRKMWKICRCFLMESKWWKMI